MPVSTAEVMAALPKGVILQWGARTTVPRGWNICDGTNGTPDLRGRFPRGCQTDMSDIGSAGGSASHQHKVAKDGGRDGRGFNVDGTCGLGDADPQAHLPPYHTVLFIMKIV